mgnify:CR=1 FL=1
MYKRQVLEQLQTDGFESQAGKLSPLAIRLRTKPALTRYPLYQQGQIEVQDEGSQLLAYLVAPKRGEMVVDFCAGAGGKTLLLGALMRSTGRLYAFDVAEKRLARPRPRGARAGLSNGHPGCISSENDTRGKRRAGQNDRGLGGPPCSGVGTPPLMLPRPAVVLAGAGGPEPDAPTDTPATRARPPPHCARPPGEPPATDPGRPAATRPSRGPCRGGPGRRGSAGSVVRIQRRSGPLWQVRRGVRL